MGIHYDRGVILYRSKHYELAEKEFRQELAQNTDNASAHAMLAFTLFLRKTKESELEAAKRAASSVAGTAFSRFKTVLSASSRSFNLLAQSETEAKEAVKLAPDSAFCHYTLAFVLFYSGRTREAKQEIEEAIRLNPSDSYQFSLASSIEIEQKHWSVALKLAEQGLTFEPDHVDCINNRALALVGLGRKREADQSLTISLAADPEDYRTHAHKGGVALEQNNTAQALEHYREALRLNPNSQWAREGVVKALKAGHPFYHTLLSASLWITSLDRRIRILLALILLPLLFSSFHAAQFRFLIALPYLVLGVADHCFNFALSFDPVGRTVLSKREIDGARSFLIGCFAVLLISIGIAIMCCISANPSTESVIAKAETSIKQGKYGNARYYYNTLIERAVKDFKDGRVQNAADIYDKVLAHWQKDFGRSDKWLPDLLLSSARCQASLGKYAEAEHLGAEVLSVLNDTKTKSDYTSALAYNVIARAQQNTGRYKEAEENLAQSVKLLENDSLHSHDLIEIYKQYAAVLTAVGKNDEAKVISANAAKIIDFQSYMAAVASKLKQAWHPAKAIISKRTVLTFQICSDGKVKNVEVKSSSQDLDMDKAAIEA